MQMDQTKVVKNLPVKRRQVVGSLETAHGLCAHDKYRTKLRLDKTALTYRNIFSFPKVKTHSCIIPNRGRVGKSLHSSFVLGQRMIIVLVSL